MHDRELQRDQKMTKTRALLVVLGVYLGALTAALLTGRLLQDGHPLFVAFIADLVATVVVFVFSVVFNNSSMYDSYWSAAPPLIALYWLTARGIPETLAPRSLVVLALVVLWAVRLTFNWARHWKGMEHEDWRYRGFRERYGSLYWPVSFFGIHLFPTLIVFLACLCLYPAMGAQLHEFVKSPPKPGKILNHGLWARCRHPNYLGEILFWWGLYLFCLASGPGYWWLIIGPAAITGLFLGISVPMMDRHLLDRKSGYAEHMRRVPTLFPRLFGK
jgi:steroid 5-alpha reductase family enzyme